LNRRLSLVEGVSVIVTIASLDGLAEGAIIEGRSIARLDPPLTIDNMEAVVVGEENGRAVIWMASDDNFNPLQRTLLLKFELVGAI
ncbi:MAG: esterase-like activity of phytase family protein, partial [Sphingomonadaceae bacterium]|nr:esterase-like activity of phytase family protein [Sphingomonadaceae bacterium]